MYIVLCLLFSTVRNHEIRIGMPLFDAMHCINNLTIAVRKKLKVSRKSLAAGFCFCKMFKLSNHAHNMDEVASSQTIQYLTNRISILQEEKQKLTLYLAEKQTNTNKFNEAFQRTISLPVAPCVVASLALVLLSLLLLILAEAL